MTNFVFMGSPDVALPSLRALLDHPEVNLRGVVTQPDRKAGRRGALQPCPVKAEAERLGLRVLTPERIGAAEALQVLREWRTEVVVVCAYGQIFPREALQLARQGCYNLHFSLLPRWRGASPVQTAIAEGDKRTGVTLQRMVQALDAGDIVSASNPVAIDPHDTSATLGARLSHIAAALLREAVPLLAAGTPPLTPQAQAGITLCRTLRKTDGAVDFLNETASRIERRWRAYTPWPGCHVFWGKRRLSLVRLAGTPAAGLPGGPELGVLLPDGRVQTREGMLQLLEIKPEGKGAMGIEAFLRGNPKAVGARLTPQATG